MFINPAEVHDRVKSSFIDKSSYELSKYLPILETKCSGFSSWREAKKTLHTHQIKPGWAIFFAKSHYIDHVAIVPSSEAEAFSLEEPLLQALPPGFHHNIDNNQYSAFQLMSAGNYIDCFPPESYSGIFYGSPPFVGADKVKKAGDIAASIIEEKTFHGTQSVYTFPIPLLGELVCVHNYNPSNNNVIIGLYPKSNNPVKGTWCGDLVGKLWESSGAQPPTVNHMGVTGYSSYGLFDWLVNNNMIKGGVIWKA
jgi:hypothetical protein